MTRILLLVLLVLLAVELGPPVWRATVAEGLCETEEVCRGAR